MPDNILAAVLRTLPGGWQHERLFIGQNWAVSVVRNAQGERRAGLATIPDSDSLSHHPRFRLGENSVTGGDALVVAQLAQHADEVDTAVGLATLNALVQPHPDALEDYDAFDWLMAEGKGRNVAVVGRFPFIVELQPVVNRLWVLELDPQPGEYGTAAASDIFGKADIVAITASTLVNHTLDGLLALLRPGTAAMLLGPTTPLSPTLFDFGLTLLCGVQVVDIDALLLSCAQGVTFRKMSGLRRVMLRSK